MPITETLELKVNKSPEQVLKIVVEKMAQKKAMIVEATPQKIICTLGSGAKTRLGGAAFASADSLPVKITLEMKGKETTDIVMTIEDNLGFGSRLGLKGKYSKYMQSLFNEISVFLQY